MTQRLQGKVALVTGAGSGIGAATAIRFAQEGATVVLCGRRQEPLDAVVAQIKAAGGKAEAVQADVSDEAGFTAAINGAAEGALSGIRVNVVVPAVVETPSTAGMLSDDATRKSTEKLIPMGRVGQPEDLANAILFLASNEASYITGAVLPVDGGRSAVLVTAL